MTPKQSEAARIKSMADLGFGPQAMKEIKVCKVCGVCAPNDAHICPACKTLLPKTTLFDEYKNRHSFCKACGTVLPDGLNYCPQCGKKL